MRLAVERAVSFALGVNDTQAPSEYRPQEVARMINGRVSFQGNAVERRNGSQRTHPTALNSGATIYGAKEFYTAAGVQQIVVFAGDTMYYSTDEGATWTQGATGLTEAYWSLVVIREGASNVLCAANGGTNSYQWDGTTWATISNIPNSVKFLEVQGERLLASGHSGVDVVASKVNDIDTWAAPDGWTVRATTHDGDTEIRGLFQLGAVTLVFKRKSVGYIEGYGYQTLTVAAGPKGVSRSVGCVAFRTIAPAGDHGVIWLSERGWEYYEIGGRVALVSRRLQSFVDDIGWDYIQTTPGLPTSIWWPNKQEYHCAVPSAIAQNTSTFVFRPGTEESPPAMWLEQHDTPTGYTLHMDTGYLEFQADLSRQKASVSNGYLSVGATGLYATIGADGYLALSVADHDYATLFVADREGDAAAPWSGGYDGFVRYNEYHASEDNADSTGANGDDITMTVRTRPFMYGDEFRRKKAKRVSVKSDQSATSVITARVLTDGTQQTDHAMTFSASNEPEEKTERVGGKGRVLQVELETTAAVRVTGIELVAQVLEDRI